MRFIDEQEQRALIAEIRSIFGFTQDVNPETYEFVRSRMVSLDPVDWEWSFPTAMIGFFDGKAEGIEDKCALDDFVFFLDFELEGIKNNILNSAEKATLGNIKKEKLIGAHRLTSRQSHIIAKWLRAVKSSGKCGRPEALDSAIKYWDRKST